jgi:mono/diheme cytochrome c family protein
MFDATMTPRGPAPRAFSLFILGALLVACSDDKDTTDVTDPDEGGEVTPVDPVARGQYLVDRVSVCQDCHTPRNEMGAPIPELYLSGAECFVQLENGSCLATRNLTNHETGLLNRSDDEIKRMFQDGIRPAATGEEALFPVMPYYSFHNMTDQDADAIVAYLRTVPGVDHAVPRRGVEFDLPGPANYLDPALIPTPAEDAVERKAALRGRYLAAQAGVCLECHTRHVMGDPNVLDLQGLFAGGEEYQVGLPVVPVSKNLTSDAETGLGDWAVEDIVKVVQQGTDKMGDGICPPMPVGPMGAFAGLTDEDVSDIAYYIKSLPPLVNMIEDMCVFPPPM